MSGAAQRFDFVDCSAQDKNAIRGNAGPRITRRTKGAHISNLLRQKWYKCENCGHLFKGSGRSTGKGHTRQYCSRPCHVEKRERDRLESKLAAQPYSVLRWFDCLVCGKRSISRYNNHQRTCSGECSKEHARRYARQRAEAGHSPRSVSCQECDAAFIVQYGDKRKVFCSDRCSKRHNSRHRDHKLRVNGKAERITLAALRKRDANRCHICGKKVGRSSSWPGGASIDHLIPVSQGGTHTWKNVALAHMGCNTRRSNTGPAQLRLME